MNIISFFLHVQVSKYSPLDDNQHLVSFRSDNKQSSLTVSLIDNGIKVVQEKDSASEMFAVKLSLFDLRWHQIALRWGASKADFVQ